MKEAIIQYNDDPDAEDNHTLISWKELVRCKDCRKNMMCELTLDKPKDWFCADGVRKEGR